MLKSFNLENDVDVQQFIKELRGYMAVSLHHGTDTEGRTRCLDSLNEICGCGYSVSIDTEPFEPPTVGNEVV